MMLWLPVTDVASGFTTCMSVGFVASRAGDWYCSSC